MALADYFFRDSVAISQVLRGLDADLFTRDLERLRLAIAFGENAASSRNGRELLDLSVRLAARLYPSLAFAAVPSAERLADELIALAVSINPNIDASRGGSAAACLSIGMDAPIVSAPTVYAGCDGWLGRVGIERPYRTSDLCNPFGAGFAACLAAANLFRFLLLPDGEITFDPDSSFSIRRSIVADSRRVDAHGAFGAGRSGSRWQQRFLGAGAYTDHRPRSPCRSATR